MSGGKFDYEDQYLCTKIYSYDIDAVYGIGSDEQKKNAKLARRKNPLKDSTISEMVYDMFCLLHSFDCGMSGDTSEDAYRRDLSAFWNKWLKPPAKKIIERTVNHGISDLEDRLWVELGLGRKDRCCENCKWHDDFSGACSNGQSEHRGDFTDNDLCCDCWEKVEIQQKGDKTK